MTLGSHPLSWPFSSLLVWCSGLREIICWVVSGCEHAQTAFERIQRTRETAVMIISRKIPNVYNVLWSLWPPKPYTSQHQVSKIKTLLKELLCEASLLVQWSNVAESRLPQAVDSSAAIGHSMNFSFLSWKIIKGYPIIKNDLGLKVWGSLLSRYSVSGGFR